MRSKLQGLNSAAIPLVLKSMQSHHVSRIIYQAGAFLRYGKIQPASVRMLRSIAGPAVGMNNLLADNDYVASLLAVASDIDFTLTLPGQLRDGPSEGVLCPVELQFWSIMKPVTFTDLAAYTLRICGSSRQCGRYVYLAYCK